MQVIVNDEEKQEFSYDKSSGKLDMVVAFDTTGSMSSYIEAVREHIKELIPKLLSTNPELQLSIVAFGDYCDMQNSEEFGYAYQSIGLTRDENALIGFVNDAKKTGGGDWEEFYELVIKKITEETNWREGSKRSVLLIADAEPHEVGYEYWDKTYNIDWREEAIKSNKLGIQWDTLQCSEQLWYKELSEITNGVNAPFKTSSKTSDIIMTAAYSRGGDYTKDLFVSNIKCYCDSGDVELNSSAMAFFKKGDI